jgi:hypothetical protein
MSPRAKATPVVAIAPSEQPRGRLFSALHDSLLECEVATTWVLWYCGTVVLWYCGTAGRLPHCAARGLVGFRIARAVATFPSGNRHSPSQVVQETTSSVLVARCETCASLSSPIRYDWALGIGLTPAEKAFPGLYAIGAQHSSQQRGLSVVVRHWHTHTARFFRDSQRVSPPRLCAQTETQKGVPWEQHVHGPSEAHDNSHGPSHFMPPLWRRSAARASQCQRCRERVLKHDRPALRQVQHKL